MSRFRLFLARRLGLFRWREVRRDHEWTVQEDVVTGRRRSVRAGFRDGV